MKISHKLTGGFLAIAFLLGSIGFITASLSYKVEMNTKRVVKDEVGDSKNHILLGNNLQELRFKIIEIWILRQHDRSIESQKKEIDRILEESFSALNFNINKHENILKDFKKISSQDNTDIKTIEDAIREIEQSVQIKEKLEIIKTKNERYFKLLDDRKIAEAYQLQSTELIPYLNDLISDSIEEHSESYLEELNEKINYILKELRGNRNIIYSSTFIALIISLILGKYLSKSISQPINRLRKAALEVGEGDLNNRVNITTKDEIGELAICFDLMVEGLKETTVSKFYLDKILASMLDSLIVVDLDGTIQTVNHATCHLLGYSKKELIGQKLDRVLMYDSLSFQDLIERGFLENYETEYITKTAKQIPVIFSSSFIYNKSNSPCGIVCVAKDISEQYATQKALKASEERYALVSRATNDGLWDWNFHSNEIYYSPRWKYLLGYENLEIEPTPKEWFDRVHPDYLEILDRAIKSKEPNFKISYPIKHKNGNYRWMLCHGIKVKDEGGKIYRIAGSQTDITEAKLAEEKLVYQATHDKLTGLPNRAYFQQELQQSIELTKTNSDYIFCVLFLDLDGFKIINDSLGHQAGDELLMEISKKILTCLRKQDVVARLGGDEFAILLKSIKQIEEAIEIANLIQEKLKLPINIAGNEVFASTSIGIASSQQGYDNIEDFLRDADTAMYRTKALGKAGYTLFNRTMHEESLERLHLEQDLRQAIDRGQLEVFYQPIVELKNQKIIGFEALLRWNHPEKGTISPGKFIPIAEETGLIVTIGCWVIEQVANQISIWQNRYLSARDIFVSVNVSPLQLKRSHSSDCFEKLQSILKTKSFAPQLLRLEITESSVMENRSQTVNLFEIFQNFGIKIAMDDFGTGYSSLSCLHSLPIDTLKIDCSFVSQLGVDPNKLELIKTIIDLAENLNLDVIAEGVETKEQLAILRELNCQYGQGYLFSKPVNLETAIALLENNFSRLQMPANFTSLELDLN